MTAVLTARVSGLHVEVVGDGPPLLVAHGGPGANHRPYRTLDQLATSRRLVFWDHRGHGRSVSLPDRQVEIADFADDVVTVADGLGIDRFALLGHSFGGWVAQEAALRHPDRVSALVLAGTTPGQLGTTESADDDQGPPPPEAISRLMSRLPETDGQALATYRALSPHFTRTADPAILDSALGDVPPSAATMTRVFEALGRWSSVDRLHRIACPTLVVAGRQDQFCSLQQHLRISRRIDRSELAVYEDSGHFPWLEEPDLFFERTAAWLDRHRLTEAGQPGGGEARRTAGPARARA